jgi:hypothetical protein
LIEIRYIDVATPPKPGIPWKRPNVTDATDDPDLEMLRAAKLAEFLQKQDTPPSPRKDAPNFLFIWLPPEPTGPFFLVDSDQNLVLWGKSPIDERPGELSSEDRWKMLLDHVEKHGPIKAKKPNYIQFTRAGVEVVEGKSDR